MKSLKSGLVAEFGMTHGFSSAITLVLHQVFELISQDASL